MQHLRTPSRGRARRTRKVRRRNTIIASVLAGAGLVWLLLPDDIGAGERPSDDEVLALIEKRFREGSQQYQAEILARGVATRPVRNERGESQEQKVHTVDARLRRAAKGLRYGCIAGAIGDCGFDSWTETVRAMRLSLHRAQGGKLDLVHREQLDDRLEPVLEVHDREQLDQLTRFETVKIYDGQSAAEVFARRWRGGASASPLSSVVQEGRAP